MGGLRDEVHGLVGLNVVMGRDRVSRRGGCDRPRMGDIRDDGWGMVRSGESPNLVGTLRGAWRDREGVGGLRDHA
ncbi:hypothetical protein V5E97_25180 [Singulisphaera sp. Ch08]|uniref:Uncharacterized protein n=1 Tax=Singulisphaera sp. Ch08 TaxID=3120278 RepID=A0AAU7C8B0_9BACT